MSTYSTNLKIELIGTGEQAGTWGQTTDDNFSNVFEQSIVGRVAVPFTDADVTLSATNTVASQSFRNVYLNCTGTNTASRNLIVPTINKNYVVENNTTGGFNIVVKTAAGTGITVPSGKKVAVYADGTNVVAAFDYFAGGTTFSSITDTALTSGRVTYATTGGLLTDSANFQFNGTTVTIANDASISGLTVGKGGGSLSNNTVVGYLALPVNTSGSTNSAFGNGALYVNTTGGGNTALGYNPLVANTTGSANTAVGDRALYSNTTANNNTAVGYQAGYSNTTGTENVLMGYLAGFSGVSAKSLTAIGSQAARFTTASENTALGFGALYANTTGTHNLAVGGGIQGTQAGSLGTNTTGSYNTAVGQMALYSNTTASNNTAVGYQAGYSNTTGANTVAVGAEALYTNSTGTANVALGRRALYLNTGDYNTGLGHNALYTNSSGSNNAAVGHSALYTNTTGTQNTGLGVSALYTNSTGSYNTSVGLSSLSSNTTGSYNTALGLSALASNTTASNNTAVGYQAGYSNTTGASNTAIGYQTMYSNTAGSYSTALGRLAGYAYNGATETNGSVFIGNAAGYTTTTGHDNTFVGSSAGYYVTTGSKNTILGQYSGNQGGLDIRTASNYIVLSDGDGNPCAYKLTNNIWKFGTGGTSADYQGSLGLNGSSATDYGPSIAGQRNSVSVWYIGSYSATVGGTSDYFACRNVAGGGVWLNGASATSWSAVSDERQKENLVEITDGASKVASLRAVIGNYIWDEEKTKRPFLIAQDVQKVLPEAVAESEMKGGGTQLGVAYTDVIPLLVAAIKELKATIDLQSTEIDSLKQQLGK